MPLTSKTPKPTLAVAVAGILLAAGGAAFFFWFSVQTLWVVNGMPIPVTVSIDGRDCPLEGATPGAVRRVPVRLVAGIHRVVVKDSKGRVLENELIDVPGRTDVVAYNVLGAAPLFFETVFYSVRVADQRPPAVELLGGKRLIVRDGVDHVFEPVPTSITTKSDAPVTRTRFDTANAGWQWVAVHLADEGRLGPALTICRALSLALPEDEGVSAMAPYLIRRATGSEAAARYLKERVATMPKSLSLHRGLQHYLRIGDRREESRAFYRDRQLAAPDDSWALLLRARVESLEDAIPLYQEVRRRHPKDLAALRGLAWALDRQGRHAEAVRLFEEDLAAEDPEYGSYADEHARALVALGRVKDALLVIDRASNEPGLLDGDLAILYARIAKRATPETFAGTQPATSREAFFKRLSRAGSESPIPVLVESALGERTPYERVVKKFDEAVQAAVGVHSAAIRHPRMAWGLLAKAPDGTLEALNDSVTFLLAAEFARAGDEDLADLMWASLSRLSVSPRAIRAFLFEGHVDPDLWRLEPEDHASLEFVRGRLLESQGLDGSAFYKSAAERDLLEGPAAIAKRTWPEAVERMVTLK